MPYVCETFEAQTWRTDRCRHCYKTEVDHYIGAAAASLNKQSVGGIATTATATTAALAASIAASRNLASIATTPGAVSAFTASLLSNAYKGYPTSASAYSAAAVASAAAKPSIAATSTITPTVSSSVTADTLAALRRQYGITSSQPATTPAIAKVPGVTPTTVAATSVAKISATNVSPAISSPLTTATPNTNNKNASSSGASFGFRRSVSRDITPRRSHSRDEKENDDGRPGPGRLRAMQEIIDDLRKESAIQKQKQDMSDREKNTTITKLRSQITDVESQRISLKAKTDVLQSKVDLAARDKLASGVGAAGSGAAPTAHASYMHQVKIDELTRKLKDSEDKSKKTEDAQKMSILRLEARLAEAEVTKSRLKTEKETQLKEVRDSVQSLEANYQQLLKTEKEAKNLLKEKEERVKTLEKEMSLVSLASGGSGKNRPKSIAELPENKRQEFADSLLKQKNQDLEVESQVAKNENERLKNEAKDLQEEIDEMQDTFREDHAEEFRELQKELEITAKNCRILQYKLRKAERKGEITEAERAAYEEKIQSLTKQVEETGEKTAADSLKTELEMSKQISLKLHEEIDGLNKTKETKERENEKLTSELSQTKKWKESMEKELKELRSKVASSFSSKGGNLQSQKSTDSANDETVKLLEGENEKLRWQVAEKERKVEELTAKVANLEKGDIGVNGASIDTKKQLKMVEHEAGMLRQKLLQIEEDNEKLINQNRQLQMKSASRGRGSQIIAPDSSFMENIELKEKVANLEKELKSLKLNAGVDVKDVDTAEVAMKMARQIASLEAEIHKLKKDQKKDDAVKGTDNGEKDLKYRIAALEQENGDLTLMIKSKETLLTKVEGDLSSTRKELEKVKMASSDKHDAQDTKDKIASMKQRLDALTQLKNKTQEQYEHANGELATEKKNRQEIENNLKQAELKAKSMKDQVETLETKLAAQEKSQQQRPGTVIVSDEAMKNLEKERDKFRSSAADLEAKLSAVGASLKNAESKLNEKEESLKSLEEKWEAEKSYLEVSLDNERKTNERENKQHLEKVRTLEEIIKGKDELISSKEETLNDKEANMRKYEESSKSTLQDKDKKIQEVEGRLIRSEKTVKELQIRLYQLEQSRKDVANRLKELGKKVEKQDKSYKQLERELKEERTGQKLEKQLFEEKYIHASKLLEKANKKLKEKEESWKQEKETLNVKLKEEKDKAKDLERTKEALEYNVWANEKKDLQEKINRLEKGHETEREAWEKERGFLSAAGSSGTNTGKVSTQFLEELESLKLSLTAEKENTKARLEKEDKLWQAEITGLKMKNQSETKMMRETQKTLQSNVERLTKEREVLKDILDGAQRNIAEVKSRYLSDAELWEVERANLISQTIEIDDVKKQMNTMRREMELMSDNYAKEKRLRTGLENKYSVEKNVWEMSQVQLNNRIRQLEELVSKAPKKTKEMQSKMDSGFEKERAEMKKLIESNNEINAKLIDEIQLTKIGKEAELTELKTRFEKERQQWEKERYAVQKRNQELEQMANLMLLTQRRLEDLQWEYGAAAEMWAYERDELQELLNDSERHIFRDREKLDELLLELEKFRRITPVLENFMSGEKDAAGATKAAPGEVLDERWRKKITQVLKHVEKMSDDLLNYKTAVAHGSPPPMKRTSSDPEQVGGEKNERRGSLPDLVVDQGPKSGAQPGSKEKKEASDPEADKRSTRWRSPARKPKLLKRQSSTGSVGGASGSRSPSRWSMASGGSRNESPTRYYSRYNYLHSREGSIYGGSEAGSDDSRGGSVSRKLPAIPSIIFNRRGKSRGPGGGAGGDKWETSSIGSGAGLRTLSKETASTFEDKLRSIGNWSSQVSEEAEDPSTFRETNVDTGETKTALRHPGASALRRSSSPSVSYLSYHNRGLASQPAPFDYDADSIGSRSGFATPSLRQSAPSQSDIHRAFGRQTSEMKLASSAAFDDAQPSKVGPASFRVGSMNVTPAGADVPVSGAPNEDLTAGASKFKTNTYDKEPPGAQTAKPTSTSSVSKTASSSSSSKAAPAAVDKGRASTPSWRSGFGAFKEATPAADDKKAAATKPTQPGIGNLMKRFENKEDAAAQATGTRGDTPVPRTQVDREKAEKQRSGGVTSRLFAFRK